MITRRTFTKRTLAFGSAAAVPSFGTAQPNGPMRILAPEGSQANLAPVIASFEAQFQIKSELIVVGVNEINAVLSLEALLDDAGIDVALPATFGIPDLVEANAILPLDDIAARHGSDNDVLNLMYRGGDIFDGHIWGYQTDGDVYLMFYNKAKLRDASHAQAYEDLTGVALDVAQTWEELDRQLAFFHRPEEGSYGGCFFRSSGSVAWEWWARFHAKGTWPMSPEMEPQIAGQSGVEALEAMIASAQHIVGEDLDLFSNWDRFRKGDVFANIGWGGTQKSLYAPGSPMRNNLVNAALPSGTMEGERVPIAYFNWGWSYVVARGCKVPELAHKFCLNAVSQSVGAQAVARTEGFFDPFREDQYADPSIIKAYGTEFLDVHRKAMQAPMPDLYLARQSEYFDALNYWLLAALAREVSPEVALQNVARSWAATTDRVGFDAQRQRWMALRQSYPPPLRNALKDA